MALQDPKCFHKKPMFVICVVTPLQAARAIGIAIDEGIALRVSALGDARFRTTPHKLRSQPAVQISCLPPCRVYLRGVGNISLRPDEHALAEFLVCAATQGIAAALPERGPLRLRHKTSQDVI